MIKKHNFFTLIELIVVIVVIGILASIVIPNISKVKEEAESVALLGDIASVQTAVDIQQLKGDNSLFEGVEEGGGKELVSDSDWGKLVPTYLRDKPSSGHFWIDSNKIVYGVLTEFPNNVGVGEDGIITWNGTKSANAYQLHINNPELSSNVINEKYIPVSDGYFKHDGSTRGYSYQGDVRNTYYLSVEDKHGNWTPPKKLNDGVIEDVVTITDISAGSAYSVITKSDGTVTANFCFTDNVYELNAVKIDTQNDDIVGVNKEGKLFSIYGGEDVPAGNNFVDVKTSGYGGYNLALKKDGTIISWGSTLSGEPNEEKFKSISVNNYLFSGNVVASAIREDGSIVTWGSDDYNLVSDTPKSGKFKDLSVGDNHIVAVKEDGTLVSWGADNYGQVSNTPTGGDFIAVEAGFGYSVALKSDGTLVAWGNNSRGQIEIPSGGDFVKISAGYDFAIALKKDGTVVKWGSTFHGCPM